MEIGIRQHALLYALICRYCFLNAEEEAEELIEEITTAYGRRRGERMHRLAAENKEDVDMNSFLIHSEWQGKEGENISVMSFEKDRTVCEVTKCAWCDAWREHGLPEYGSHYCRYIDKAICEGFDGGFDLKVSSILSKGDQCCRFEWTEGADPEFIAEQRTDRKWILPFSFHCRELFQCTQNVLRKHSREEIAEEAEREFLRIFPDAIELFSKEENI